MDTIDKVVFLFFLFLETCYCGSIVYKAVVSRCLSVKGTKDFFRSCQTKARSMFCLQLDDLDPAVLSQVRSEIAEKRCKSLQYLFHACWILSVCIMLLTQGWLFFGGNRNMTNEFSFVLFALGIIFLAFHVRPSLLTIRNADVAVSVIFALLAAMMLPSVTSLQWRKSAFRCVVFTIRGLAGATAQRFWVSFFWQTVYCICAISSNPREEDRFAIGAELTAYIFLNIVIWGARSAMEEKSRQEVLTRMTRNELHAASSLLHMLSDAVVHLDENLKLIDHSPQLSTMLMCNGGQMSVAGADFSRFLAADEDRKQFEFHLKVPAPQDGMQCGSGDCLADGMCHTLTPPLSTAFHADLKDAFGTKIKAEFFSVLFSGFDGSNNHLLGIREYTDIPPLLPASTDTSADSAEHSQAYASKGTSHKYSTREQPSSDHVLVPEPTDAVDAFLREKQPLAVFDVYLEMIGCTSEFQMITTAGNHAQLGDLFILSPASTDTIVQLKTAINNFVHDKHDAKSIFLKFDGALIKRISSSSGVKVDQLFVKIFKDASLGLEHDTGLVLTLHMADTCTASVCSFRSSRSRSSQRSSRSQRSQTVLLQGTSSKVMASGNLTRPSCLSL